MIVRKFMSRSVTIVRDGKETHYPLSIATVAYDESDEAIDVSVQPYIREIPGVEYVDTPLVITIR